MIYKIVLCERWRDGGQLNVDDLKKDLEQWYGKDTDSDRSALFFFPKDEYGKIQVTIITSYKMIKEIP